MKPKNPALLALGRNIRRRRESLDLSQETLAEKADLDRTYISGIERGLRNLGFKNVVRIAKALETSTPELCKGVDA